MKRTIKCLGVALAPVALSALLTACSHKPAQSPGTSAPSVESGTPSGQTPGSSSTQTPGQPQTGSQTGPTSQLGSTDQGGQQFGQSGQDVNRGQGSVAQGDREKEQYGQQYGQRGQGQYGQQQPGQQGLGSGLGQQQGQVGEQGATGAAMNERALCDALAAGARLRAEDVQNGVAIVAVPKGGTQLSSVRDDARRLESAIRTGSTGEGAAGAQQGTRSGETCGIAELGRLPSVTVQVNEGTNSVRILMTTSNNNEVRDLRRIARDELNALTKAQGGQKGIQHQGTPQKGGTQQPGMQQQNQGQEAPETP
ncbi:MAG: hypothetical protein QM820_60415 [Minicystis sp.]